MWWSLKEALESSPVLYLAGVLRACVQIMATSLDYFRPHVWKFREGERQAAAEELKHISLLQP